jgi:hypothetical protein
LSPPFPDSLLRLFLSHSANKPVFLQKIIDLRKRFKGPPQSGSVTIVVTDIEGGDSDAMHKLAEMRSIVFYGVVHYRPCCYVPLIMMCRFLRYDAV